MKPYYVHWLAQSSKHKGHTDKFYVYYFFRNANPTLTDQVVKYLQVIQVHKTFNYMHCFIALFFPLSQ